MRQEQENGLYRRMNIRRGFCRVDRFGYMGSLETESQFFAPQLTKISCLVKYLCLSSGSISASRTKLGQYVVSVSVAIVFPDYSHCCAEFVQGVSKGD